MTFGSGIVDQLTGYPYSAGAAAAGAIYIAGMVGIPDRMMALLWNTRMISYGAAGYATGIYADDNGCSILKGMAGGAGVDMAMALIGGG